MADVIEFKQKPVKDPRYWGHICMCFLFSLRDDGVIVCEKCENEIGYWIQDANGNPQKPL